MQCDIQPFAEYAVAPHMGAWIETTSTTHQETEKEVAPHMGAWIETWAQDNQQESHGQSHPIWVRGLKPIIFTLIDNPVLSHPIWVRGLKLQIPFLYIWVEGRTPYGCVD